MRLQNKVAIVTGGGSGIGEAICRVFSREGAKVVAAGIVEEDVRKVANDIQSHNGIAKHFKVDVAASEQVQKMMDKTEEWFGKVDILVNNAAVQYYGTAETMKEEDWTKLMNVNLTGPFLCTKYVIPLMKKHGHGSIINMGSATALVGIKNLLAYSAAKGGLLAMTRTAAHEMAEYGIRVNALAPGTVKTPIFERHIHEQTEDPEEALKEFYEIFPLKKLGTPEDIALACVYLASDESSFVTGTTMVIDGGYTIRGIHP